MNIDEPLIATGYALGTNLPGKATTLKGRFIDFRKSKQMPIDYIQTDISLVKSMSGDDGEVEYHYYEGAWQTVKEDGVYKMLN